MRVAITGGTGLIGSALVQALLWRGDEVVRLVRRSPSAPGDRRFDSENRRIEGPELDDVDAVVNLAGAPIARRWSAAHKQAILTSRLTSTETIASALSESGRCRRFLSGSAIGFYGSQGATPLDETSPAGDGFLADVVVAWEAAAREAAVEPVFLRTGHVMSPRGGYLGMQLPAYRLGLGGPMGDGSQMTSWITLDDHVRAMLFLLDSDLTGPVNLTAPEPVTNARLTRSVGAALHRPTALTVPLPLMRLAMTPEMVSEAILSSQTVLPHRLKEAGFTFVDTQVEPAMARILS